MYRYTKLYRSRSGVGVDRSFFSVKVSVVGGGVVVGELVVVLAYGNADTRHAHRACRHFEL